MAFYSVDLVCYLAGMWMEFGKWIQRGIKFLGIAMKEMAETLKGTVTWVWQGCCGHSWSTQHPGLHRKTNSLSVWNPTPRSASLKTRSALDVISSCTQYSLNPNTPMRNQWISFCISNIHNVTELSGQAYVTFFGLSHRTTWTQPLPLCFPYRSIASDPDPGLRVFIDGR